VIVTNTTLDQQSPDHYKLTKPKLNESKPMAFQMPKEESHNAQVEDSWNSQSEDFDTLE
jgi:hypothetical protein